MRKPYYVIIFFSMSISLLAQNCPNLSYPDIPWGMSIDSLKQMLPRPFSYRYESMSGGISPDPEYPIYSWFYCEPLDSIHNILMKSKSHWGYLKSGFSSNSSDLSYLDKWRNRPSCWGDQTGLTVIYEKNEKFPFIVAKRYVFNPWGSKDIRRFKNMTSDISNRVGFQPDKYTTNIRDGNVVHVPNTNGWFRASFAIWNGKTMRAYLISHTANWSQAHLIIVHKKNWEKFKSGIR